LSRVDSVAGQEALGRHFPGGSGSPAVIITKADAAERVVAAAGAVPGVAAAPPAGRLHGYVGINAGVGDAADSRAAMSTVESLRTAVHAVPDADAVVGGQTATQVDVQNAAKRDRVVIIPIVLAVIFVVLALLLRALLAPLLLIATVVLSF